jgi:4-hydroxy-3-polyprenylbenzoate decarboxylase
MNRLIVGISGASGVIYGIRLLEVLKSLIGVETHLVMSRYARLNIEIETDHTPQEVEALADVVHNVGNQAASISSGSFRTDGMVIAPCSMKTLSAIANSAADSLLARAADVVLKEQRRLVLMPREAPLHVGHCKLLYEAAQLGAVIAPPMPAFYNHPQTIDDLVNHSVGRVLDLFDLDAGILKRWERPTNRSDQPAEGDEHHESKTSYKVIGTQ